MKDYFLRIFRQYAGRNLDFGKNRFKGVGTKKREYLIAITLVLAMRLFFSIFSEQTARAELVIPQKTITVETLDPLSKINRIEAEDKPDNSDDKTVCSEKDTDSNNILAYTDEKRKGDEDDYLNLLKSYPMADMVPYMSQLDRQTASFLIAIAKKESDWGNHAPSKNGRDCFNYWGYKGSYNLVQGYSCFDSPEQAVSTVGQRISELIDKKINTPERMVVWKCGSSCAGHDPEGVKSWIGTVRMYFDKLTS